MPGRLGDSAATPKLPRPADDVSLYRSALNRKRKSTMERRLSYTWVKPKSATMADGSKGDRRSDTSQQNRTKSPSDEPSRSNPPHDESLPSVSPSPSPPPEIVFDSRFASTSKTPTKYQTPPPQVIFTIPKDYSMRIMSTGQFGFEKVVFPPSASPPSLSPPQPSPKGFSSAPVSPVSQFEKVKHRLFHPKFTPSPISKERAKHQDTQDLEYLIKHFLGDDYSITGPGKL
uniref:Hydroxyproline-rich glycoprotein family protein n=1 Tax=Panagrellus redivivus TaxID=6233 RepID=A0A7E4ZV69_PANRE